MKTVKIGYLDYQVVFRRSVENFGSCDHEVAEINISDTTTAQQQANTLLHEALHGIWHVWNLPSKPDEETAVTSLANGLVTMFADNPDMLDWLGEQLNDRS